MEFEKTIVSNILEKHFCLFLRKKDNNLIRKTFYIQRKKKNIFYIFNHIRNIFL